MTKEIWKAVKNYEGYFEVSNLGRVRRIAVAANGTKPSMLKANPQFRGYLFVWLYMKPRKARHRSVSRLVAENFLDLIPGKPFVNHKNGIVTDNRLVNLEFVDHSENVQHAIHVLGRQYGCPGGDGHPKAKLSSKVVKKIRTELARGTRHIDLANKYGVGRTAITNVAAGRTWRSVT